VLEDWQREHEINYDRPHRRRAWRIAKIAGALAMAGLLLGFITALYIFS
jgi:hypothetical protein